MDFTGFSSELDDFTVLRLLVRKEHCSGRLRWQHRTNCLSVAGKQRAGALMGPSRTHRPLTYVFELSLTS